jgi:hypothetical protein
MLATIFLSSCGGLPKVTLHQIDTRNNRANPFLITKYNENTCELELQRQPHFPILGPQLHGAVCVTREDYAKLQKKAKQECLNAQDFSAQD